MIGGRAESATPGRSTAYVLESIIVSHAVGQPGFASPVPVPNRTDSAVATHCGLSTRGRIVRPRQLEVRKGFFGAGSARPIDRSGSPQDTVVRQLVGRRSPRSHRELIQRLPLHGQFVADQNPVTFLDRAGHHPVEVEFIWAVRRIDGQNAPVFNAVRIDAVDDVASAELASVALHTGKIATGQKQSERNQNRERSHSGEPRDPHRVACRGGRR